MPGDLKGSRWDLLTKENPQVRLEGFGGPFLNVYCMSNYGTQVLCQRGHSFSDFLDIFHPSIV
jgi:hypothetical protein